MNLLDEGIYLILNKLRRYFSFSIVQLKNTSLLTKLDYAGFNPSSET